MSDESRELLLRLESAANEDGGLALNPSETRLLWQGVLEEIRQAFDRGVKKGEKNAAHPPIV